MLSDPVVTDDAQAAQWHQFITATLYFATQRWPDVREVDRGVPARPRHLRRR